MLPLAAILIMPLMAQDPPAEVLREFELTPVKLRVPSVTASVSEQKLAPLVLGWDINAGIAVAVSDKSGGDQLYGLTHAFHLDSGQVVRANQSQEISVEGGTARVTALGFPFGERAGGERYEEIVTSERFGHWPETPPRATWQLRVDGSNVGLGPINGEGRLLRFLGPSDIERHLWLAACPNDQERGFLTTAVVETRLSSQERIAAVFPEAQSFLIRTYSVALSESKDDYDIVIRAYRFDGRSVVELKAFEDPFAGTRIRGAYAAVSRDPDISPDRRVPCFAFADRDWVAVAGRGKLYVAKAGDTSLARLIEPYREVLYPGPPVATHSPVLFRSGRNLYLQLRHAGHDGMGVRVPLTYALWPDRGETTPVRFPFDLHSPGVESGTWFAKDLRDGKHVVLRIRD